MTFILLLLLQFSAFAQKDIYSLTDQKTKGTPTIRLRPTRFLVYQALASSSKATAQREFSEAISRTRNQVTQANIIPIGILNADIEAPNDKEKKKDFILMASPVQKDIFQANVQFQISPKLLQTNLSNQIESIEISFDNGDNWKTYKYEEQLISYQFKNTGEQEIGFRINSKKGTYVTFATIDVKQLIRPSFAEPKRVSASSVRGVGETAAIVNGAEYRIHLGCDGIFDKPIIIAEGFDVSQNVNLDDLTASYFEPLRLYRNNGYDLVLVNYDNARTWIQDNAQVLKAVINQVNNTKIGNNKLVVIGESMSGLVARWALKEMENAGQNPNVSHFVAFDSPMRGANVPPGLIGLRRWLSTTTIGGIAELLDDLFGSFPALRALDEPAARQMLLTQQFNTPAPEFAQFQTAINTLGYPSQYGIKNIALINGALDGAAQRRYTAQDIGNGRYREFDQGPLNDGDRIFDFSIWALLDAVAWTHRINQSSYVGYGNQPVAIFAPIERFYYTSPINYDRHPGGRIVSRTGSIYTSFSFVPTFSSIDYRGTLNNNNDYYFNIRNFRDDISHQVTNTALTPFTAIYGDDANDFHADPEFETDAFNTFGRIELGITNTGGCIGCTAGSGGLAGTYFGDIALGIQFPNTSTTDVVNYNSNQGRPTVIAGYQNVSARWEGSIQAPITGNYTFNMRSDDGCRVWFDGTQRVDDWGYYGAKDHPFQVSLTAGERKNIRIEWFQGSGDYVAEFYWTLNGGVPAIVPACYLFPTATGGGGTGGGTGTDRTELGSASDDGANNPGNEGEAQAFDNSNFTKWLVFNSTGNIAYDFANDDSYAINSYTVTSANDEPARDPRNWNLQGSNNGSNWTTVNTQNNQSFQNRFETKTYNISNTTPFRQYRLNVTGNNGSNLLQIAEIQMFGPTGDGGCTPPNPPSISTSSNTSPADLTANGCNGTITWSNGSNSNPLTGVGSGTYTATCTVNNCTSGSSNSVAIGGGGGSCPTYNNPQWFHWDYATSNLWFAHYGPTGKLYASTDANPDTPALTRQQLLSSGVTPTLANCFLDGTKSRMAAVELEEIPENIVVYPNPTTGKIKIVFALQKAENVWLNLYDGQGKYLDLRDFEGKSGRNEMEYDLQNYPSGAYFVNFQSSEKREVLKVMKVN